MLEILIATAAYTSPRILDTLLPNLRFNLQRRRCIPDRQWTRDKNLIRYLSIKSARW